jgi:hypothetical protein
MDSGERIETCSRPLVDSFAGLINDPILRLRFLKAVAPPPERKVRKRRRAAALGAALAMLAAILCIGPVRRAATAGPAAPARTPAADGYAPEGPPSAPAGTPAPVAPPATALPAAAFPAAPAETAPSVWLVDKSPGSEIYSNGLRIDDRFSIANHPRSYVVFPADAPEARGIARTAPAGIVFHATESRQAPFEPGQNGVLKRIGQSLLESVREKRAYHFLIDRFGRVYRVVAETDAANHAGYSVWSDGKWLYINLNESFLGVSFEAETHPGQVEASITPAQVRAGAMLVETLRSRYAISARNCVTHAQVSVNPSNMRVGYHVDWASGFPFEAMGLPDNYSQPLPALAAFGFEYDPSFLRWAGTRLYAGVTSAGEILKKRAAAAGMPAASLRRQLQKTYRERLAAARRSGAADESN